MSWNAVKAVLNHSKINSAAGLSVMLSIAHHMDDTGALGHKGAASSPTTIDLMETARTQSKTTFLKWVGEAVDLGEIEKITHGLGRGGYCEYHLLLPMDGRNPEPRATTPAQQADRDYRRELLNALISASESAIALTQSDGAVCQKNM